MQPHTHPRSRIARPPLIAPLVLGLCLLAALLNGSAAATVIGSDGHGAGQFERPDGLAVDQATGDLYVGDRENHRIDVLDSQGGFIFAFGFGVRTGAAELQTCTAASGCRSGIEEGAAPGQTAYPTSVALEAATDDVWVLERNLHRVEKFHLDPVSHEAEFLLMIGGEVDQGPHHPGNLCTAAYLAEGDACGAGSTGTGAGQFARWPDGFISGGAGILAVGGGKLYVGDENRVQEFNPDGTYAGELSLPGSGPTIALALDPAGDLYVRNATYGSVGGHWGITSQVPGVREFDSSGTLLHTVDEGGEAVALATNSEGEIFIRDREPGTENATVLAFDENGGQTNLIPVSEVTSSYSGGLAIGETAKSLYLSETDPRGYGVAVVPFPPEGPGVEPGAESTSNLLSTTGTLHAQVNPKSKATTYRFQYLPQGEFEAHGFAECGQPSNPSCHETSDESLPGPVDFSFRDAPAHLSGLQAETTYHYRVLASSHCRKAEPSFLCTVAGSGASFTTFPPALFSPQGPTGVSTQGATLHAYLNPEGLETTYRFQYVDQSSFEAGGFSSPATQLTPAGTLAPGASFVPIEASVSGLSPGTTYHVRVLAENAAAPGPVPGPDFPFTTPAAGCPNEALRTENDSTELPQCRAYERVSPEDKEGYAVRTADPAPSGERVAFKSLGNFAGNPSDLGDYLATRGEDGWQTTGIDPPLNLGGSGGGPGGHSIGFASPELDGFTTKPVVPGASELEAYTATNGTIFLMRPGGSWQQAAPTLEVQNGNNVEPESISAATNKEQYASTDLSRLFLASETPLLPEDTYEGPGFTGDHARLTGHVRLYEIEGLGGPEPLLHLVSVDEQGAVLQACNPLDATGLFVGGFQRDSGGISADGRIALFSSNSAQLPGGCAIDGNWQVLARVDGQTTVDLSQPSPSECGGGGAPQEVSCQVAPIRGAAYMGASASGRQVVFITTQQLTDAGTEDANTRDGIIGSGVGQQDRCENYPPEGTGCNLYMYDFNRPAGEHLVALSSGDSSGVGPQVRGVLGISRDGSHAYYVAGGVLSGRNDLGQEPRAGAENLYVTDTETGQTSFISDLCTGVERSGPVASVAECPSAGNDEVELVQRNLQFALTPGGRYLLFATYARLTPDDTNEARDVYRYDALTGALVRISAGHDGFGQNGNAGGQDAGLSSGTLFPSVPLNSISADGTTAVFNTGRALDEHDTNNKIDAYLWHEGEVTLLTGGSAAFNAGTDVSISPSGRDITFTTAAGLVPNDRDGLADAYDARIGGGFPLPGPPPPICESGETCPGKPTEEQLHSEIGSETNEHPPEPCPRRYRRRHGHCVPKHRRHHRHHRNKGHHHNGRGR